MLPKEIFGFSPQSPLLWVCDSLVVSNARQLKKFVQTIFHPVNWERFYHDHDHDHHHYYYYYHSSSSSS